MSFSPSRTKIVFFGTPLLAVPFLEALVDDPTLEVVSVVTQPDRPVGRLQTLTSSPVKEVANRLTLPCLQPSREDMPALVTTLSRLHPELFVVVAYGALLPKDLLQIPPKGSLNVHPSLLPRFRGPSPLQEAIRQRVEQTGVSIMLLDEGMDTGPLLAQGPLPLHERETLETLTQRVMTVGPPLLVQTLHNWMEDRITPTPQPTPPLPPTKLLSREDGRVNWKHDALALDAQIRGYTPWPGCWTIWRRSQTEERIKILEAEPEEKEYVKEPGLVGRDEKGLWVQTGKGILRPHVLQLAGKPVMSAEDFLRGYSDVVGSVWE